VRANSNAARATLRDPSRVTSRIEIVISGVGRNSPLPR
jgi:hypothetical protein